jgi:RNA polymerase primary sigma factor
VPALPRLRSAVLAELARELRFQAPESARRQLARAEDFAIELLSEWPAVRDRAFPAAYVVFRVTGLRNVELRDGEGAVIPGEALLADVPALAERLSVSAGLGLADVSEGWVAASSLARRWGVSVKTLDRYRRRGLPSRRVRAGAGRERVRETVWVSERAVSAFERVRAGELERARGFSRLSNAERARALRWSEGYRRRLGWSLNRSAERIAERLGRSLEGVRGVLRRAERERAVFAETGVLRGKRAAALERRVARGASPSALGRELGKDRTTVYKAAARERARRLRSLELADVASGATFARVDAAEVILGAEAARAGLGVPRPATVGAWAELARAAGAQDRATEQARAAAFCFLRWRAARAIGGLRGSPAAGVIDRIETDLRWAEKLRAALAWSQVGLAARTVRSSLGASAEELPPTDAAEVVAAAMRALGAAVERFDPFKGGRLAAPASLELARELAGIARSPRTWAKGRARPDGGSAPVGAWGPREIDVALDAGGTAERLAHLRHGVGGASPMTIVEAAGELGVSVASASRTERAAGLAPVLEVWGEVRRGGSA